MAIGPFPFTLCNWPSRKAAWFIVAETLLALVTPAQDQLCYCPQQSSTNPLFFGILWPIGSLPAPLKLHCSPSAICGVTIDYSSQDYDSLVQFRDVVPGGLWKPLCWVVHLRLAVNYLTEKGART